MGDCPETMSLVWGDRFESAMTYMCSAQVTKEHVKLSHQQPSPSPK